jgi:hypothetical protein
VCGVWESLLTFLGDLQRKRPKGKPHQTEEEEEEFLFRPLSLPKLRRPTASIEPPRPPQAHAKSQRRPGNGRSAVAATATVALVAGFGRKRPPTRAAHILFYSGGSAFAHVRPPEHDAATVTSSPEEGREPASGRGRGGARVVGGSRWLTMTRRRLGPPPQSGDSRTDGQADSLPPGGGYFSFASMQGGDGGEREEDVRVAQRRRRWRRRRPNEEMTLSASTATTTGAFRF